MNVAKSGSASFLVSLKLSGHAAWMSIYIISTAISIDVWEAAVTRNLCGGRLCTERGSCETQVFIVFCNFFQNFKKWSTCLVIWQIIWTQTSAAKIKSLLRGTSRCLRNMAVKERVSGYRKHNSGALIFQNWKAIVATFAGRQFVGSRLPPGSQLSQTPRQYGWHVRK